MAKKSPSPSSSPSAPTFTALDEGHIASPKGFRASGVFCDIKRLGTGKGSNKGKKNDLAALFSEMPCAVGGMFTTNQVCAAPVKISQSRVEAAQKSDTPLAQAVVINSGNANACTGEQGMKDALKMALSLEKELKLPEGSALVCSTGRIGVTMPMKNVSLGIKEACKALASDRDSSAAAANAILTSDSKPKEIAVELEIGGVLVRIGGMCKGAGMIQPGMSPTGQRPASMPKNRELHATMLGFITTDVAIESSALQSCLEEAVAGSFNGVTVDGDMSTNDTVLALANGMAGNKLLTAKSRTGLKTFQVALNHVCLELAKMIVRDGEGVSRVVRILVEGAMTDRDADLAARSVGNSALVKTSWCGGDPNWGRIMDAIGYSEATVHESKVSIGYRPTQGKAFQYSLKQGKPTKTPLAKLRAITEAKEFDLLIDLGLGRGGATLYAADLTEEYVDFNKGE